MLACHPHQLTILEIPHVVQVLTAELLGEFPDARGHLQKVTADDPFNVAMLFPEHREFSTDARQFLDAEHAAALPRRGVDRGARGAWCRGPPSLVPGPSTHEVRLIGRDNTIYALTAPPRGVYVPVYDVAL